MKKRLLSQGGDMPRKTADNKVSIKAPMPNPVELPSTKSRHRAKKAVTGASGLTQETSSGVSRREKIALLAYTYWEQRGRQGGSPEEDWYRAEREVELGSPT
jgi:hypothetical protein